MGRLLLRTSMRLIGLVDQLSVHIWQDGDHRGRESEETIVERSTDLASGVSVSVVHRCRSLLLSFSILCYLGILGLEGAINCILARTSHQRTTSEKRTKALLPKVSFIRRFHCNCIKQPERKLAQIILQPYPADLMKTLYVWRDHQLLSWGRPSYHSFFFFLFFFYIIFMQNSKGYMSSIIKANTSIHPD